MPMNSENLKKLICIIDEQLLKGSLLLAIEGGSAAGKTSLAEQLRQHYDCPVFHTDDYFLRPEQRTAQRLAEPGGNMDRERFKAEILCKLTAGETVVYRPFDCGTMRLKEEIQTEPGRLNIIEGAYCMHPELSDAYGLTVFLDIEPELQRKRIGKRNTPEKAQMFFSRWIPMEQKYFEAMKIKDHCDIVIHAEE